MGADRGPKNLGIRISQPFVDVGEAEDKDLIFSSSFPLLKEDATGVYNINGVSGAYVPVHRHNLGYHPFYLVWDDQSKMRLGSEWLVDTEYLYFLGTANFPPTGGSGNFRWSIYRLPLFTFYKSGVVDTQTTRVSTYNPDYGLKTVRKGKRIDSEDLNDFTLHSRGRCPQVHEVNVKEWGGGSTLENHDVTPSLPYNPIAFGFALDKTTGKVYNMQNGGQSPPTLSRTNQTIRIRSTGDITARSSIVVFKDPFLAPVTKEIRY